MEAGVGYRVSYARRSLSSARGVLRMGLRWHIGNGPMASCYGSRSGLFSVKTAYYLQLKHGVEDKIGDNSNVDRDMKFWKFLWSLSLPLKIKAFLWRTCIGIHPTNGFLWHRHTRIDGVCPCCPQDVESVVHALWTCIVANDVWLQLKLPVQKWDRSLHCFFDLMVYSHNHVGIEDLKFFCCIAYFIWGQRNSWVHEGKVLNPVAVVSHAQRLLTDYNNAYQGLGGVVSRVCGESLVVPVNGGWRPPGLGLYKVNWAIFRDLTSRHCFLGSLIRDHESCVLGAMVMKLPLLPFGIHPTVGAVIHALQFAREMGFRDIILEGPSLPFMLLVGPVSVGVTVQDMWLEGVEVLRQHFTSFSVAAISKEDNAAAVALVWFRSSVPGPRIWIEEVPVEIQSLL
uniref:Reverse transcriptase zinc-binding domain-containing protein n=1 Tax=Fagus sylvatica TaxID=28930 RepID=A0A2N9H4H5_FAGSY